MSFTYIFGTLLTANGNMKLLNITAIAGIVVNVCLNLILIPQMEAQGAAIASLSTQSVVSSIQIIIVFRELKIPLAAIPYLRCALFTLLLIPAILLQLNYLHLSFWPNIAFSSALALLLALTTRLINLSAIIKS
jgi:O-antigen/teichoic acid export membrane protein